MLSLKSRFETLKVCIENILLQNCLFSKNSGMRGRVQTAKRPLSRYGGPLVWWSSDLEDKVRRWSTQIEMEGLSY